MSNTKRLTIFLASFFVTIFFLILLSLALKPLIINANNNITNFIIFPLYLTLSFYFLVFFHAFLKKILYKKYLLKNAILLTIKADKITITDRLWYYLFIVLIYFAPIYKGITTGIISLIPISLFVLNILLIEVILKKSLKTIRISFFRAGIVITGFDTRFNIPMEGLGTTVRNDYGYYSYNDIDSYFPFPDRVELFLTAERGKLVLNTDSETMRQLQGIIVQQKIKKRKHL